jgi:hypothetical protein
MMEEVEGPRIVNLDLLFLLRGAAAQQLLQSLFFDKEYAFYVVRVAVVQVVKIIFNHLLKL